MNVNTGEVKRAAELTDRERASGKWGLRIPGERPNAERRARKALQRAEGISAKQARRRLRAARRAAGAVG